MTLTWTMLSRCSGWVIHRTTSRHINGSGPVGKNTGLTDPDEPAPSIQEPVVWIVNQYAVSRDLPGITRHVELGNQLLDHGWRTRIFATSFHHTTGTVRRDVSLRHPVRDDVHDEVAFTWLHSTKYRSNGWKRYVNMVSFTAMFLGVTMWTRREQPSVVIGSSPHLIAPLGAWIAACRHRVPFLFEVRDVWPDMLVQLGLTSPLVIKPLEVVERFLYRRATKIVALTDGIAERIAAKGVPRERIVVIPNSTLKPLPLDPAGRSARRAALGWQDKVVLVWAGSHNPMNGLDVVVEAASRLVARADILFVFVGDGSLKGQLIEQARGLPNVEFHNPMPKTEIGAWLQAADIGLLHSRRFEVFNGARPNKLFEYMAAGLPIVSTVPGEAWQLVEAAGAGVYAPWENPDALAQAVADLADSPDDRQVMGKQGYDYVGLAHSREATATQLAALLMETSRPVDGLELYLDPWCFLPISSAERHHPYTSGANRAAD